MKKKLLRILLIVGSALTAQAQIPVEMTNRFQTVMDSLVNDFETQGNEMGFSLAVSIPGYGTWQGASGHAEPGVAMTTNTTASIASNSKLFTAVILLKLQESNILSLDDQIGQWIPDELHDIDKTATIRQLLKHETGYFDYENDNTVAYYDDVFADLDHFWTYAEQIDKVEAPHFEVGTAFRYSNTNYILAAWIIENATGNSYAHNLHQYITAPLGLTRTFDAALDTAALDAGPEASTYILETWWPRLGSVAYASMSLGCGSIVATSEDIVAFYDALLNTNYLSVDSKAQMLDFEHASHFGLGIRHGYSPSIDAPIYHHGGDAIGYHSLIAFDPVSGASMFFVINNEDAFNYGIDDYTETLNKVFKDYFPKQANDAGISHITSPVSSICGNSVTPVVRLKNFGSSALTLASISYSIDNGTAATYTWNGSLASGETTEITLPAANAAEGSHTFTAWTSGPNGSAEGNTYNDSKSAGFVINPETVILTSFSEDFEGTAGSIKLWSAHQFPVGQWGVTKLTGSSGNHSLVSYGSAPSGDEFNADLPMIHVSNAIQELRFNYAHSNYQGFDEKLEVLLSIDCGETWSTLFNKQGDVLSQGLNVNTAETPAYFPHTADEWHTEAISLSPFSSSDILIRFRVTTVGGERIYLDDISVGATLSIADSFKDNIRVYPNPASDKVTIAGLPEGTLVTLYSISGQKLQEVTANGDTTIDISSFAKGMYFLQTATGSAKIIKK